MFKITPKIRLVWNSDFVRAFVQVLFHPVSRSTGDSFAEPEICPANSAACSTSQRVVIGTQTQPRPVGHQPQTATRFQYGLPALQIGVNQGDACRISFIFPDLNFLSSIQALSDYRTKQVAVGKYDMFSAKKPSDTVSILLATLLLLSLSNTVYLSCNLDQNIDSISQRGADVLPEKTWLSDSATGGRQ